MKNEIQYDLQYIQHYNFIITYYTFWMRLFFCFAALALPILCWTVLAWKRKNRRPGGLRRVTKTHLLDGDECCICLERFVLGKVVAELDCEHIFHLPCIQPWFKLQNTCPLCRKEVDLSKWKSALKNGGRGR